MLCDEDEVERIANRKVKREGTELSKEEIWKMPHTELRPRKSSDEKHMSFPLTKPVRKDYGPPLNTSIYPRIYDCAFEGGAGKGRSRGTDLNSHDDIDDDDDDDDDDDLYNDDEDDDNTHNDKEHRNHDDDNNHNNNNDQAKYQHRLYLGQALLPILTSSSTSTSNLSLSSSGSSTSTPLSPSSSGFPPLSTSSSSSSSMSSLSSISSNSSLKKRSRESNDEKFYSLPRGTPAGSITCQGSTDGSNKFKCLLPGCTQSFDNAFALSDHCVQHSFDFKEFIKHQEEEVESLKRTRS